MNLHSVITNAPQETPSAIAERAQQCRPPLFSAHEWQQLVRELPLTQRQSEIVGLILQGKSDKEIERLLGVKRTTIRTHFADIQMRLGVTTRIEVVCWVFAFFRRLNDTAPPQK